MGHLIRSAGGGGGGSPYKRMLGGKGMGHLVLGGAGGSHGMCYFKQWRRNPNVYPNVMVPSSPGCSACLYQTDGAWFAASREAEYTRHCKTQERIEHPVPTKRFLNLQVYVYVINVCRPLNNKLMQHRV